MEERFDEVSLVEDVEEQLLSPRELKRQLAEMRKLIENDLDLVHKALSKGEPLNAMVNDSRELTRKESLFKYWAGMRGKRVTIQLHTNEDPKRNFPVFVALNGKTPPGYSQGIPRGIPVTIPGEFLEVLDLALHEGSEPIVDDDGNSVRKPFYHLSYPYIVIGTTDGQPLVRQLEQANAAVA